MTSVVLFILLLCSFVFYGIVGKEKLWLEAPVWIATFVAGSIWLIREIFRQKGSRSFRLPFEWLLFGLFLIWSGVTTPSSAVVFESTLWLVFMGCVFLSYLVWANQLTAFKDNRLLLGTLIFAVMLAALYGLVVHFKCPEKILWAERYTDHYKGRLMSTYICPNHFAHLMQMLIPFCLALIFIPQSGVFLRLLAGYSFIIFLPTLFYTESRAGWLGSIAAVGAVICLIALRKSKLLFALLAVLVPLSAALLLAGAWRYSETFQRRMTPVVNFLSQQNEDGIGSESRDFRPQTWMDTIDMIKENPVKGTGLGSYEFTFPSHRKRYKGRRTLTVHPHNEYLEMSADSGLAGFALFGTAWLSLMFWTLIRSLKAENVRHAYMGFAFIGMALGTMVHSFFDFQMHIYPNMLAFAFLSAVAVTPLKAAGASEKKTGKSSPFIVAAVALAVLVGAGFSFKVIGSALFRVSGDAALSEKKYDRAEKQFLAAVKLDEANWKAYRGLGRICFADRYYNLDATEKKRLAMQEREWFEAACKYNPQDPDSLVELGRVLFYLGWQEQQASGNMNNNYIRESFERFRAATKSRPFNDLYWWELGVALRKTGQYEEALAVFEHAATIGHKNPSVLFNIKWLKNRLKNGAKEDGKIQATEQPTKGSLLLKKEETDLSDLLEQMGK